VKKPSVIILLLLLTGCVKVPVQSIKLNQIIHDNIQDLHQKHVNLVHEYFKLRLKLFDDWFLQKYEPAFKTNYQKVWNEKHQSDPFNLANDAHRKQYVQDSIAEYDDLVSQIKTVEGELVQRLDTGYSDVVRANETVTALLESAKSLTDEERNLWNNTVGKLFPPFEAEKIDAAIKQIQDKAITLIGGKQ
jgi:hypothetical protein